MNILFVHHLPEIGGATQSLLKLVQSFQKRGHKVEVVFFKSSGSALNLFSKSGIPYSIFERGRVFQHAYGAYIPFEAKTFYRPFVAFFRSMFSISPSYKFIKSKACDVVYLNTSILFPFAIAAKLAHIACVWHLREQIHDGHFGFRKWWLKFVFKRFSKKIFVISKTNQRVLGHPSEVVYNSVDLEIFKPNVEEKEFLKTHNLTAKFKIVFLGGRVMSKGAELFVEAASILTSRYNLDVQFIIVGAFNLEGDENLNVVEKKVGALLEEHSQLKKSIMFTGSLDNVAPLLSACNILVWPAKVPHFARPIMEAMAIGIPVIASDFESTREILQEGVNGFLTKPDAQEIANQIYDLLQKPQLMDQMSSNNKEKARVLFDASINNTRIVTQTEELISDLRP